MVEFISEISAIAVIAIGSAIAAALMLEEKRRERSRVLVPVRARSPRR